MGKNVIFITTTGAGTWTVPADWNSSSNTIECIGNGGNGAAATTSQPGAGGGGGGYSAISNLTLTPGASINFNVGTAASADTWFNATTFAASSVGAKGGTSASGGTKGTGGASGSGIGTTLFSGGDGFSKAPSSNDNGGGGGGAAGPNGAGNSTSLQAGGSGDAGFGGAGGPVSGANGSAGTEWTQTSNNAHAGSGGGASGGDNTPPQNGGVGGLYGAGGGGGGTNGSTTGTGGAGAQGLIVITYTHAEINYDWPNPRGYIPAPDLKTWVKPSTDLLCLLAVVVPTPNSQTDWPNPRGPSRLAVYPIGSNELRLILRNTDTFFGGPGQPPANLDWPNPRGYPQGVITAKTLTQNNTGRLISEVVHAQYDWPNPRGYIPEATLKTFLLPINLGLRENTQFFYAQGMGPKYDYPNPKGYPSPRDFYSYYLKSFIYTYPPKSFGLILG